jgi:hypothetical protein
MIDLGHPRTAIAAAGIALTLGAVLVLASHAAPAAAASRGRPVCTRVGTRSEGWAWPDGRFIHWAKCKGVVPQCHQVGPDHATEGWYANGVLIAAADCSGPAR